MKIIISPRAFRDIEEIREYLHQRNPQAAKRVAEQIGLAIDRILLFPDSGRDQIESSVKRVVERRYGHLIYYRYTATKAMIEIVAVRHARREPLFENT